METRVRSWLVYLENVNFSLFLIYRDRIEHAIKIICRQENPFGSIYDFSISHRVWGKEYTHIQKSSNLEIKNKK
jgi:hypothetical protein